VRGVGVRVVNEVRVRVREDLRIRSSKEEKNEKLQVQPNWRSGQILLKSKMILLVDK
jgi:hypothetical protein